MKMKRIFVPCSLLTIFVLSYAVSGQVERGGTQESIKLQSRGNHMNYVRAVDFAAIDRTGPGERFTQALFDHTSGAKTCTIHCIKTPAGGGSPAGLHTHQVDQIFYILKGTMSVEIEGKQYEVGPGTLVVFPAGVAHRNWNGSSGPTVHLAFNTPMPDPNLPFATSVKP
jgi:mannose-6-phosphate isomerase-like protein (cupin superfamily)